MARWHFVLAGIAVFLLAVGTRVFYSYSATDPVGLTMPVSRTIGEREGAPASNTIDDPLELPGPIRQPIGIGEVELLGGRVNDERTSAAGLPCTLVVLDQDGLPVESAPIVVSDAETSSTDLATPGVLAECSTDARGQAFFILRSMGLATVKAPPDWPTRAVVRGYLEPGETAVLRLGTALRTLRFVDAANGAPAAGLRVEISDPFNYRAASILLGTDVQGEIGIPGDLLRFGINVIDRGVRRLVAPAGEKVIAADGHSTRVFIDGVSDATLLVLRVEYDLVLMRLLDMSTGQVVHGPGSVRVERLASTDAGETWHLLESSHASVEVVRGTLRVPARAIPKGSRFRLVVCVAGYCPHPVLGSEIAKGASTEVYLSPTGNRSSLQLRYADGTPVSKWVRVFDTEQDLTLASGVPDTDGRIGIGEWCGSRLRIEHVGPPESIILVAPIGDVEPIEATLDCTLDRGSVTVLSVPDGGLGDVEAVDTSGTAFAPTATSQGVAEFANLPAGVYAVGPSAWTRALKRQGIIFRDEANPPMLRPDVLIEVLDKAQVQLEWRQEWLASRDIVARVTCGDGNPIGLALLPIYGARRWKLIPGHPGAICLDEWGRYSIPRGCAMPDALVLVARGNDVSGWPVPLALSRPGVDIYMPLACLLLTWEGTPRLDTVKVFCTPEIERQQVDVELLRSQGFVFDWDTRYNLRMPNIPLGVRAIVIRARNAKGQSKDVTMAVQLRAGAENHLVVHGDDFG